MKDFATIANQATAGFPLSSALPGDLHGPRAQQKPKELELLLELIDQEKPNTFLEIGSYYGGLAWAIHQAFPKVKLICVDNNSLDSEVDTGQRLKDLGIPATFINGDSTKRSTLTKIKKIAPQVDFTFIDASHRYDDVSCDWALYSSITKPNGIVVLADIAPHEESTSRGGSGTMDVDQLWEEIKDRYEHWVIQAEPKEWGVFGVIRVPG